MQQPIIKFENFSFRYHNLAKPSLKNINLEIYASEKILITGRSGSGKSSLLHCLNGIIPHTNYGEVSGHLEIANINPVTEGIFATSNKVGTILQDQDSQFIGLSVGEDVAFSLENAMVSNQQIHKMVQDSLAQVNMLPFIEHSPHELSGGQKQSVSLAGILASSPEILLFDEPLANLDPYSVGVISKLIKNLNTDSKKTIVIVEHRIEECLEMDIDKIVVMDNGNIVAVAKTQEILYSNIFNELGIREPLYITALKKANLYYQNLSINNYASIENLSTPILANLSDWANQLPVSKPSSKTTPEVVLELKNISFAYYDNQHVLDNINFKLHRGEIISLLGNNGAGKSTLTQIISGVLTQKHGEITLDSHNIDNKTIKERGFEIAVIMQNPNHMLVRDIVWDEVALGLFGRGLNHQLITEKIEKVLKTCGLWGYRNWPISALSYGQKKRVTIAAMLVLEPKVLILDEPTAGQDLRTYHDFMKFISELAASGIAILIITHDLYLALEYTSRSVIMCNGKIIADAAPQKVFANTDILSQAHLKEISLSKLANKLNIDSADFIQCFIEN